MTTQTLTPDVTAAMVHYMNREQPSSVLNVARVLGGCDWATACAWR